MDTSKTKKTVYIILGLSLLIGLIAVGVGYYLLNTEDISPTNTSASKSCACYYAVTTDTARTCNDLSSKSAFEFQVGSVKSDGNCSVVCDTKLASNVVGGNDKVDIISCKVDNFANAGCLDVSIQNDKGDKYANSIMYNEKPIIVTKFKLPENQTVNTNTYKSFQYVINGQKIEITDAGKQVINEEDKTVSVKHQLDSIPTDADKLTVQAFANTQTNSQITSEACYRELKVQKDTQPYCKSLDFSFTDATKIKDLEIELDSIQAIPKSISTKLKLSTGTKEYTTKDILSKFDTGIVKLDGAYLYNNANFTDSKALDLINTTNMTAGEKLTVTAVVTLDGKEINSQFCTASQTIPLTDDGKGNTDDDDDNDNPTNGGDTTTLDIQVTNTSSRTCVERTSPNNTVLFTILIRELSDDGSTTLQSVKNKLPLGFTYQTNSTIIDGVAASDSGLVTVSTVGSTQEIVWSKSNWTIGTSSSNVQIQFRATASSTALTGQNLNEVVVEIPDQVVNINTLRSSVSINVAQSCTAPETGIFDSTLSKVVLSLIIIGLGLILYYSEAGNRFSLNFINSPVYRSINMIYLKLSGKREYFENKVIEKIKKKN